MIRQCLNFKKTIGEFVVATIAIDQLKLIGINLIGILNHVQMFTFTLYSVNQD